MDGFIYPVELEYRQAGRTISGAFKYGATATVSDRGRARKERFGPRAFEYAVNDETREINLLSGHSLSQPLASRRAGSLKLKDSDDLLEFTATLPVEGDQPSWIKDTVLAIRSKLVGGISPGFRIPPKGTVPNAEELIPEPGNPGVFIRLIRQAVLFELSLVTRPAYPDTAVSLRSEAEHLATPDLRMYRWL